MFLRPNRVNQNGRSDRDGRNVRIETATILVVHLLQNHDSDPVESQTRETGACDDEIDGADCPRRTRNTPDAGGNRMEWMDDRIAKFAAIPSRFLRTRYGMSIQRRAVPGIRRVGPIVSRSVTPPGVVTEVPC